MKLSWQLAVGSLQSMPAKPIKVVLVFFLFVNCQLSTVNCQDIHFTQFFTAPLILNPAQTGYFDGNYRLGFNFRAQWPWAISGTPYNYHTESANVDFSFGEKKIKTGWMGIGFDFLNDEAGDGFLTYRRFGVSYAYHQALDKAHRYILSAGANLNYVIRSVNFSKFYFNSQWVEDQGFDLSLNSGEPIQRTSFGMADLGAGIHFGAQVHERVKLDFGLSMLHINRPGDSFYDDGARLGFRYQADAGMAWQVSDKIIWNINAYYGDEKDATEFVFGSMAGYQFNPHHRWEPESTIYFGLYCRINDAIAPLVGYQFKQTRILFSYDMNDSKLLPASKLNGGPEISLVHIGKWDHEVNGKKMYCPKF